LPAKNKCCYGLHIFWIIGGSFYEHRATKNFAKPPQSYWMASTPKANYPTLEEDIKVDVAIIGGGITGIATSYMLGKAGVKVAVIEADRILQGTTGHTTAKITSQHDLIYSKIYSQNGQGIGTAICRCKRICHSDD